MPKCARLPARPEPADFSAQKLTPARAPPLPAITMRGESTLTLATVAQGNVSQTAIDLKQENIFTVFPLLVDGTRQVETATVVGTITAAGNATVVFTSAAVTGSPVTKSVAVLLGDTAAQIATKIAASLTGTAAIAAAFDITSSGATVIATRKVAAANDATLNVSVDNGTCAGLTTAATSANTTAGAATGVGLTLNVEGQSPNDDWHPLCTPVAYTTTGAKDPIQLQTFCKSIRARLSSWTVGQLTVTGIKAVRG